MASYRSRLDINRRVGVESRKLYGYRCVSKFWDKYLVGPAVVDIGYRGGDPGALTIIDGAFGVEQDTSGYDGYNLPLQDGCVDVVHASHVLEHVEPDVDYLTEWFRVLRTGGTMILMVPHAYLYERRLTVPPSRWSPEHLRSYTPASLLQAIEDALQPNTFRIRHLADADQGYDYTLPITVHPVGALEIECVIQKIDPPAWHVEP